MHLLHRFRRRFSWVCAFGAWLSLGPVVQAHGDDQAMVEAIIGALTEELMKAPDADLFIRRGELYRHSRDWAKAEADFAAAARADPRRAIAGFLRARTLVDAARPAAARPFAEHYRDRVPQDPEAWFLRGEVMAALGDASAALADYAEGFRRATEPNAAQVARWGALLATIAPRHEAEVLSIVDAALARVGPKPALIDLAIELEVARENFAAALARIEHGLQQGRWPGTLLARRGAVLARSGDRAGAVTSYRAVLDAIEKLSDRNRANAEVQKLGCEARAAVERLSSSGSATAL